MLLETFRLATMLKCVVICTIGATNTKISLIFKFNIHILSMTFKIIGYSKCYANER